MAELPDLADPGFWSWPEPARLATFAELRRRDEPLFVPDTAGGGFHALVRHADVVAASRDATRFGNEPSVTTPEPPCWVRVVFGESMVNMDGPRHAALRRVVQRAFTSRRVRTLASDIQRTASDVVDEVVATRPTDFVPAVAAQLPTRVICDLMGIAPADRRLVLDLVTESTEFIGVAGRPRLRLPGQNLRALARLHLLVRRVGRQRRREPTADLVSALVTTDVAGERLTGRQLGAFFSLLIVAGIETTRNALAHGLVLLTEHPEQRELLTSDLDRYLPGAVEEIVRYASPIRQFRRHVRADSELTGHAFQPGDRVVLFYVSANRDERVFDRPDVFDITRDPNPHVGFGGAGAHYCLGANLARQEIAALFRELLVRAPHIRATGPPELIPSSFDNRVRRLPFTLGGS
jgi:cytochrome P450